MNGTLLKILQDGDPILRMVAAPVTPESYGHPFYQDLIDDMIATMRDAKGCGLAAPQVGESVRIIVLENVNGAEFCDRFDLTVMINPVIVSRTPITAQRWEGCLSVLNQRGLVTRPLGITVEYLDYGWRPQTLKANYLFACALQHEIDHLDGILYTDKVDGLLVPMKGQR